MKEGQTRRKCPILPSHSECPLVPPRASGVLYPIEERDINSNQTTPVSLLSTEQVQALGGSQTRQGVVLGVRFMFCG